MGTERTSDMLVVSGWSRGSHLIPREQDEVPGISQVPPHWKNHSFRLLRKSWYSDTLYDSAFFLSGKMTKNNYMVHMYVQNLIFHVIVYCMIEHWKCLSEIFCSVLSNQVTLISPFLLLSLDPRCFSIKRPIMWKKNFRLWNHTKLGLSSVPDIY